MAFVLKGYQACMHAHVQEILDNNDVVYMKICVYGTLAKLVLKEEKKENPDPIYTPHPNTTNSTNTI